jgi:hypothetical protein
MYSIYKQPAGTSVNASPTKLAQNPNLGLINSTRRFARRGEGRPADPTSTNPGPFYYDEYVIYDLDTPFVADPGIYFVTVSQLAQTGIELGGNIYRMGQVITIYDPVGGGAGNFNIAGHPEMAQNRFWFETTFESGSWAPMLTTIGNPGYPHLNISGQNPADLTHGSVAHGYQWYVRTLDQRAVLLVRFYQLNWLTSRQLHLQVLSVLIGRQQQS